MRKQHTESAASSTRRTILGESAFVFEASGQSGKMDEIKCSSNKAKTFQKILGGCTEVYPLMWRKQVQRAGYGGLGRSSSWPALTSVTMREQSIAKREFKTAPNLLKFFSFNSFSTCPNLRMKNRENRRGDEIKIKD